MNGTLTCFTKTPVVPVVGITVMATMALKMFGAMNVKAIETY